MKKPLLIIFLLFNLLTAAQSKKQYTITRATSAPKIDGVLNDTIWQEAQMASNFI